MTSPDSLDAKVALVEALGWKRHPWPEGRDAPAWLNPHNGESYYTSEIEEWIAAGHGLLSMLEFHAKAGRLVAIANVRPACPGEEWYATIAGSPQGVGETPGEALARATVAWAGRKEKDRG